MNPIVTVKNSFHCAVTENDAEQHPSSLPRKSQSMRDKLRELIGQPNVWLCLGGTNTWIKNVQILDVTNKTVTFRYEDETEREKRLWEKTTRIKNITEVEVKLVSYPKDTQRVAHIRGKLSNLLEQELEQE